jgi:hypothetical protein
VCFVIIILCIFWSLANTLCESYIRVDTDRGRMVIQLFLVSHELEIIWNFTHRRWWTFVALISFRFERFVCFLTIKQEVSFESSTHFRLYGAYVNNMLFVSWNSWLRLVFACLWLLCPFLHHHHFSPREEIGKWDNHLLCSWITSLHVSFQILVFVFMSLLYGAFIGSL